MKKPLIILENIRSAYNVGNIIRTADALGYDVVLSGFTPHPDEKQQSCPETDKRYNWIGVKKTSLGAEESVNLQHFRNTSEAIKRVKEQGYVLIIGECIEGSMDLHSRDPSLHSEGQIAILVGNENSGVLQQSIDIADYIVHIPMQGAKESLNVGQAAAILMRELAKN